MSEINNINTLDSNNKERLFDYSDEEVEVLRQAVWKFIDENHLDPNNLLFAGYDPSSDGKTIGQEHYENSDNAHYFFGDASSLQPSDEFSDDPEIIDEHWVVSPLNYALCYGSLGVYSLERLNLASSGGPEELDEEFGTYVYSLPYDEIKAAQIGVIDV